MTISFTCPVPKDQRPLEEFNQFTNSWFFSWPTSKSKELHRKLIISWIISIPIVLIIETGNYSLQNNIIRLFTISIIFSLILPLLILFRQWLGWNYILRRLISEKIEYEESGWYDGQVWEKPTEWRAKDLLIAEYEVKPIINKLIKTTLFVLLSFCFGFASYTNY